MTVLVVAFFTSVTTESISANSYANEVSTKQVADSALNCVIGTIRQATSQGSNIAWASQPGMIRTYGNSNGTASYAPLAYYKLYSSDNMVVSANQMPFNPTSDFDAMWSTKPAIWCDLNSPLSTSGTAMFPIIDGNGIKAINKTAAGSTVPQYFGYDVDGDGYPDVDGFSVNPVKVSYNPALPLSGSNTPVSMPVKWIYMLRDGTLTAPDGVDSTGKIATWTSVAADKLPTYQNPIVARMAFWTDDETAKININTASEGTFWDTPVCNTQSPSNSVTSPETFDPNYAYEWDLAERQGAQHEYQRYPGHPATTSLTPVLGTLIRKNLGLPAEPAQLSGANWAAYVKAITDIVPRITDDANSSQGGTKRAGPANMSPLDTTVYKVNTDMDRLFASQDELALNTLRTPQWASVSNWEQFMETSKFFLTANSRAPEVNLFNKPRVVIWPITKTNINNLSDVSKMTPFDKLIAFCGTLGNSASTSYPYYFARQDPASSTTDWSTRNSQLYSYLQTLTGQAFPGFGGSNFASKYGADRDQILTEIFDYIRCTNLADTSDGTAKSYTPTDTTDESSTGYTGLTKQGQVVPIVPGNGTRGFGRIATIKELGIAALKVDNRIDITKSETDPVNSVNNSVTLGYDNTKKTKIQFALLPDLFCPMAGLTALCNDIRIKFTSINLTVTDKDGITYTPFSSLPFAAGNGSGVQPDLYDVGRMGDFDTGPTKVGGYTGIYSLTEPASTTIPLNIGSPIDSVPPTGVIVLDGTSPPAGVSGADTFNIAGSVTVEIHAPNSGPAIQTFTFTIPPGTTMPIPRLGIYTDQNTSTQNLYGGSWAVSSTQYPNGTTGYDPAGFDEDDRTLQYGTGGLRRGRRFMHNSDLGLLGVIMYGQTGAGINGVIDSVISLVATGNNLQGDLRLVAGKSNLSTEFALYPFRSGYLQHSLINTGRSSNDLSIPLNLGTLVKGFSYAWPSYSSLCKGYAPPIPAGIAGVKNANGQLGDWDNGSAYLIDGPYLNKPDEGMNRGRYKINNTVPYFSAGPPYIGSDRSYQDPCSQQNTFFSPNRMIPSAVMFGSLSTGVLRNLPWQTLLFRPAKSYLPGGINHPGSGAAGGIPPDHLLLDLFWMPVVEPYAISEPLSTAGKVNMNYQIVPFTYIKRDTGMRALLQSEKITAINPNQRTSTGWTMIQGYKTTGTLGDAIEPDFSNQIQLGSATQGGGIGVTVRRNIDIDDTLRQFDELYFNNSSSRGCFVSPSEICDVPLIPSDMPTTNNVSYLNAGITYTDSMASIETKLATFWNANKTTAYGATEQSHVLTGDNTLERPYRDLYPRLTTKSNSFMVHVWVQSLMKIRSDGQQNTFKEGRDQVAGEFRGSFAIERYVDPNDPTIPDFATAPTETLDSHYCFRVLSCKRFGQ